MKPQFRLEIVYFGHPRLLQKPYCPAKLRTHNGPDIKHPGCNPADRLKMPRFGPSIKRIDRSLNLGFAQQFRVVLRHAKINCSLNVAFRNETVHNRLPHRQPFIGQRQLDRWIVCRHTLIRRPAPLRPRRFHIVEKHTPPRVNVRRIVDRTIKGDLMYILKI